MTRYSFVSMYFGNSAVLLEAEQIHKTLSAIRQVDVRHRVPSTAVCFYQRQVDRVEIIYTACLDFQFFFGDTIRGRAMKLISWHVRVHVREGVGTIGGVKNLGAPTPKTRFYHVSIARCRVCVLVQILRGMSPYISRSDTWSELASPSSYKRCKYFCRPAAGTHLFLSVYCIYC
jgi:hypothetical protein